MQQMKICLFQTPITIPRITSYTNLNLWKNRLTQAMKTSLQKTLQAKVITLRIHIMYHDNTLKHIIAIIQQVHCLLLVMQPQLSLDPLHEHLGNTGQPQGHKAETN